jgi:MraZ protein
MGAGLAVEIGHLFSGNVLGEVDAVGRVFLPAFIRTILGRRSDSRIFLLGPHESDPCLIAYDPGHASILHAEVERSRLRDEAAGASPAAHHARARRTFGMTEDSHCDAEGWTILPPRMRRRAGIEDLALFVGAGPHFEIWNPQVARQGADPDLRELAEWRLGEGPACAS